MKKLGLLLVFLVAVAFAASFFLGAIKNFQNKGTVVVEKTKKPLMRVALVADSENENDLLAKALAQAQGSGINFVIGLGDWSQVGTEKELSDVKAIFDRAKLPYYLTPGDHDLWDARNRGEDALANYKKILGKPSQELRQNGVEFVIVDNSDIYKGIDPASWSQLTNSLAKCSRKLGESENQKAGESENQIIRQSDILKIRNSESSEFSGSSPHLCFVFSHKTPFHPESSHVMGEDSTQVARQAENFMSLMETQKVNGFFSGDLHFFAEFKSPDGSVKMTTVGAASSERNFQGPRFAILTIWDDYSWEVADVEIR